MTLTVKAWRTLKNEPVFIKCEDVPDNIKSAAGSDGKTYPAQKCDGGVIIIADIVKGENQFTLSDKQLNGGITMIMNDDEKHIDFKIDDKLFTSYVYSSDFVKPFLGPVYTSDGNTYTRLDFTTKEHPHHRSIFLGVGDVNGIDFWNEPANRGGQNHQGFNNIVCGSAFAEFTANNVWVSVDNEPMMDESRTFIIYNQSEKCRYIDMSVTFTSSYRDITFGATKEAGPLGIRVNEELRADKGTGHMVNSYGAVGEKECWGRSAQWCDYSGTLNGIPYGIAVFDNEKNERFPTAWHIRDYGLFAANNLFFKGGFDIPKGESITYKYRICFHEDDFNAVDRFIQYANG